MIRKSRWNTGVSSLVALVVVFVVACPPAHAQVKPFKVTGGGIAPDGVPVTTGDPRPHWAVGHATELGNYYGQGMVQIDMFTSPTTAEFSSAVPFVFIAANGDKLAFTYGDTNNGAAKPGTVTLFPVDMTHVVAVFVAEFNPVPARCTGRFAKVIGGSFIMTAVTDPFEPTGADVPVGYTWSGEGSIVFKQGK
jgi:hypothetical protein